MDELKTDTAEALPAAAIIRPPCPKYLERRIETLIKRADSVSQKEANGDIYGAPLDVFRRWNNLWRLVGELSVALKFSFPQGSPAGETPQAEKD